MSNHFNPNRRPVTVEVKIDDFLPDYDDPRNTPEWQWIEKAAWMKHVDNDADAGVFEFMVNVDRVNCDDELRAAMPELISKIFDEALKEKVDLIIFYQG